MSDSAPDSEGETITTYELLERSARAALELQREGGSFPSGRNYTYDEPETPVRTTSQWTIVLSEAYEITNNKKFRDATNTAVDYLLNEELRPHGYTFHCRNASGKDHCNGLVGQAYPIRALTHAGLILERDDAIEAAKEVFELHPFNEDLGIWERVEITGERLSFDRTLNHQILFAAGCAELIPESQLATDRINTFLNHLKENMRLHSDGLIKHYIRPSPFKSITATVREPRHWRLLLNEAVHHYYSRSTKRRKKEIGYQCINLRGLAQIKESVPDHHFWRTELFEKIANSPFIEECKEVLYGSIIPGTNAAWTSISFNNDIDSAASYIALDLSTSSNSDQHLLGSSAVNDIDQLSVISFLVGLPNIEVEI
ncbi:hypothetical protein ACLI4Z_02155 [Natrialbaceae archaeon A-arb3/5]